MVTLLVQEVEHLKLKRPRTYLVSNQIDNSRPKHAAKKTSVVTLDRIGLTNYIKGNNI